MSLSLTKYSGALLSIFATATAYKATWVEGECPVKSQNKEDFDIEKVGGLWFEYLTEDYFHSGMDDYVCSSFMWLADPNGPYTVYHSFMFPSPEEQWAIDQA